MKKYLGILLAALAVSACFKDDRMDNAPQDYLGFSGVTLTDPETVAPVVTLCSGHYLTGISKSGRRQSAVLQAVVTYDASLVAAYNTANGTSFTALPETLLHLTGVEPSFSRDDDIQTLDIAWDVAQVQALYDASPAEYVIPLKLLSKAAREGRDCLLLRLQPSSLSLCSVSDDAGNSFSYKPVVPGAVDVVNVRLLLDYANPREDMTVEVDVDESLLPAYQKSTGNYYNLPPDGSVFGYSKKVDLLRGELQANVRVVVDNAQIGIRHPGYILPLRIRSTSLPVTIAQDSFYLILPPAL